MATLSIPSQLHCHHVDSKLITFLHAKYAINLFFASSDLSLLHSTFPFWFLNYLLYTVGHITHMIKELINFSLHWTCPYYTLPFCTTVFFLAAVINAIIHFFYTVSYYFAFLIRTYGCLLFQEINYLNPTRCHSYSILFLAVLPFSWS